MIRHFLNSIPSFVPCLLVIIFIFFFGKATGYKQHAYESTPQHELPPPICKHCGFAKNHWDKKPCTREEQPSDVQ